MSARKMRLVAAIIRGKKVNEALNTLRYTKKEAAGWMEKLLVSAIANWENKQNMSANADDHDLVIKTVLVDEAGMLKRFRPAPHGRAHRIRKRSNHVTLVVENKIPLEVDYNSTEEE
ncbi:UNVERIFIED_CONTAM: hypothetical protein GTU68_006555 [Idotea baltica]|nr:hypothetical protein [Idotea baltica]